MAELETAKNGFILCIEITNGYHIVFDPVNA